MKKKLISLVCALSMVATLFASFTVVNAASPSIVGTATKNGNKVTVEIKYDGFTKVSAAQFEFPVDITKFEAVDKAADVKTAVSGGILVDNYDAPTNTYIFGWSGLTADTWLAGSGTLATITLTVKADAKVPKTLTINNGYIKDQVDSGAVEYRPTGTDNKLTVDDVAIFDPDAPAAPLDRPTTSDEAEPTAAPTPVTGAQIKGEATLNAAGTEATVVISYEGFTKVSAAQFEFPVDTTKFEAVNKATDVKTSVSGGILVDNYDAPTNTYIFGWSGLTADTWLEGSGTLATITLKLKDAVDAPIDLAINNGYIKDQVDSGAVEYRPSDATNKLQVVNPSVAKPVVEKPYTKKDIKLSDIVGTTTTGADDVKTDGANENPYYVVVTATKNGSPATYEDDYVAYYNGLKLTQGQLNNYLAGKYGTVADALANITFSANSGVKIDAELDKIVDGEAEKIQEGSTTIGGSVSTPKPTPTPTAGVKVTADKTEISSDGSTRVNAVVTDAEGATPGSEVKFTVSSGADVLDFDGATEATVALADNKASVRVYAKKVGTATVKAAYTYTDKDGAEQTKEGTVTIRVKNTSISGGSDGDNKKPSSGGPIAGPSDSINNGTNWLGAFTDLDSVEWAKPSILALSLKGIVSGRGDGTFAPNDNITRAEYCQILIGAIEKSAEYADSEFADVPSDAWFYHAVSVASKYGIVSGYGDGNFGPYDLITRQDMALMTYKAAQVMNKDLSAVRTMSFADAGAISAYAAEAVQTLADANIINGVSDTEFAPKANATRAQAAKILYDTFVKIN